MNLLELEKGIKEHKVIEHIKDGIADGLLHGERDDTKTHYYYKIGYDFGLSFNFEEVYVGDEKENQTYYLQTRENEQQEEIANELA